MAKAVLLERTFLTNALPNCFEENLDAHSTKNLLDIMEQPNKKGKVTFVFSRYDQRVVNKARRVITIEGGKLINNIKK